jgi:chorismate mutase/prephenate dehydratase
LAALRGQVDDIDLQLLALLNNRGRVVQEIGKLKRGHQADFYAPAREQEIYERLTRLNPGPFPNGAVRTIFREVISASRAMEGPVTVAYLGPQATFTHMACVQWFGQSVSNLPMNSIKEVFREVERGRADFGVVPIENSSEGVVNHTLDLFVDSPLQIFGEVLQEVSHHLLSKSGRIEDIRQVCSHSHALAQCKVFLETHLPHIQTTEVGSTARAAEMAQGNPEIAAIASDLSAQLYHLVIIRKRIEDHTNNVTRFLVISQKNPKRTGRDKTSILFAMQDRVGALYETLRPLSEHGINLTKIESRPSRKKAWEYLFYVDLEGHLEDPTLQRALDDFKTRAIGLKVLGSYPMAERRS